MRTRDVTIIGAGIMGASIACELSRSGASVTLVDQAPMPNPEAASFDHSKVFRFAYPDRSYVKLAGDALSRWHSLEADCGARLLTQTGALLIGKRRPSFETQCYDALCSSGVEAELLDGKEVHERFPQFSARALEFGVFDPSGAILHAESALRASIELARRRGVELIGNDRVIDITNAPGAGVAIKTERGETIESEHAVIASGPWSRKLCSDLASRLKTTRQEVAYFEPLAEGSRFQPRVFPIFIELESGFYGFPIHNRGAMKIANHHKGLEVDPDSRGPDVEEQFIEKCRAFFAQFIPALKDAVVIESRVCVYNNTPDDDFIIDWYPGMKRVLIVTGFSGHGFKFAPTIGRIAADLLSRNATAFDIDRFRLARFVETQG